MKKMTGLKHDTTIKSMFLIWLSGKLIPQVYGGGDSSCQSGERVIFAYPAERSTPYDISIFLPSVYARLGITYNRKVYSDMDDAMASLFDEPEYHIFESISLSDCKISMEYPLSDDEIIDELESRYSYDEIAYCRYENPEIYDFIKWLRDNLKDYKKTVESYGKHDYTEFNTVHFNMNKKIS